MVSTFVSWKDDMHDKLNNYSTVKQFQMAPVENFKWTCSASGAKIDKVMKLRHLLCFSVGFICFWK